MGRKVAGGERNRLIAGRNRPARIGHAADGIGYGRGRRDRSWHAAEEVFTSLSIRSGRRDNIACAVEQLDDRTAKNVLRLRIVDAAAVFPIAVAVQVVSAR